MSDNNTQDGQSLDELRQENALLRAVIEKMPFGLTVWRLEDEDDLGSFRLLMANPAIEAATGAPFTQLIGATVHDTFPAALQTEGPRTYAEAVRTGEVRDLPDHDYPGDAQTAPGIYAVTAVPLGDDRVATFGENITPQREAEQASRAALEETRQAESRLRALVTSSPAGMVTVDELGVITDLNPAAEQLFGYSGAELVGRPVEDLVPQDLQSTHITDRAAYASAPEARSMASGRDLVGVHKNGTRIPVEVRLTPLETNGFTAILATVLDITERVEREATERQAREYAERVLATVQHPLVVLDRNLVVLNVNRAFTLVFGSRADAVVGLDFLSIQNRLWDLPDIRDGLGDVIGKSTQISDLEVECELPETGPRVLAINARKMFRPGNNTETILIAFEDITDRKRREQELERLVEERTADLRRLLAFPEQNPNPILRVDASGALTYANRASAEILSVWECDIGGALPAEVRGSITETLSGGDTGTFESQVGEQVWSFSCSRTGTEDTYLYGRDVTDQKRTEAQLQHAQRMEAVGRLAGGVAHDFNNVLTAIFSFGGFVMEDMHPEDPAYADMGEVLKAAGRAQELTKQLLAFSRKQTADPKPLIVNGLVGDMDRMLRRLVGEDIEFATKLEPELWTTKADPGHLEQVLVNLAVNARDAMPGGGKMTIETANAVLDRDYARAHGADIPPGDYVMFAITDNGQGMDKTTQLRIFEPFFTTKPQDKGTGLGLSTCYGIVKQAGGYIWVYSEVGRGTTFKVYLPRYQGEAATLDRPVKPKAVRGHEAVLVAEDDDAVRALTVRSLARQGYRVLEAANGGEALLVAEQHGGAIDLLVTDVVMPRMSGRQLATRLLRERPDTRVLFISGYTENAIVHHGVLEEGVTLLQKPFTPGRLSEMVRSVLDSEELGKLRTARARILCVDDDPRVLKSMRRLLKAEYEVVVAADGEAALELISASDFDLVLCDVVMEPITGAELYERVREARPDVAERFVFVTGMIGNTEVDELVRAHPQPTLTKPLDADQVRSILKGAKS